ncbi:MAG: hypothetical protein WD114_04515 [Phycisphaerales bacterium]
MAPIQTTIRVLAACAIVTALASCSMPEHRLPDDQPQPQTGDRSAQTDPAAQPNGKPAPTDAQRDAAVESFATMTLADARRAQTEVMDFTDDLTVRLVEAVDQIELTPQNLEARVVAHRLKFTVAHGATLIAAARNPQIALLDMMVMIRIQRQLLEKNVIPVYYGKEADRLMSLFVEAEQQIRTLASRNLTEEQVTIVDGMADRWVEEHPTRKYGAYARLSEFSAARQMTTGQASGGRPSNVLGFLFIDPLSGLDPTTREIEQARMFAERGLFYLQRMPMLVSWQTELLLLDTVSEPESRQLLGNAQSVTDSIATLTSEIEGMREQLPELVATEREAALDRMAEMIDEQRTAAIDQAFAGLREERTLLIEQLAEEEERLGAVVTDLRLTVEASTELSESVARTTEMFSQLSTQLGLDDDGQPADPDAEPFVIGDYTQALQEATRTAEELTRLTDSISGATDPEALEARLALVDARIDRAEDTIEDLLDRLLGIGLTLVIALIAGLILVVILWAVLRAKVRPAPASVRMEDDREG